MPSKLTPPSSSQDAQRLLHVLMATLRHIRAARKVFGMDIVSKRAKGGAHYFILDYGIFVRERLLQ